MQNNWLHRILNYKVTPPDGVWKDIANKLDAGEEKDASDIAAKMNAYEATPPLSVYTNIFNELDKETDNEENLNSSEKLYHYSETPPAGTWENITAELDKTEAVIVPISSNKNSTRLIYRIAAAASLITIVIVTALLFIKKDTTEGLGVANNTSKNNKITPTPETNNTAHLPVTTVNEKTKAIAAVTLSRKKSTNDSIIDTFNIDYVKNNTVPDLATKPDASTKEMLTDNSGKTPMDIGLMNAPNTYISMTGPDGQSVKVSSKFSNLIEYFKSTNPDTVENIDIIISESAKWRSTFAAWRDKMTNNAVAPSLGNFMDMIELSNVLENKK